MGCKPLCDWKRWWNATSSQTITKSSGFCLAFPVFLTWHMSAFTNKDHGNKDMDLLHDMDGGEPRWCRRDGLRVRREGWGMKGRRDEGWEWGLKGWGSRDEGIRGWRDEGKNRGRGRMDGGVRWWTSVRNRGVETLSGGAVPFTYYEWIELQWLLYSNKGERREKGGLGREGCENCVKEERRR